MGSRLGGGGHISLATLQVGFAGEDTPKSVYPSAVGLVAEPGDTAMTGARAEGLGEGADQDVKWRVGSAAVAYRRDDMELRSPYDVDGFPSDESVMQALLDHAFNSRLLCSASEHPVLLTEPAWNSAPVRETMTEYMFENYQTPGLFISKAPVLSTFMNAKASAVVLDVGHSWMSAVPVHEGYVLRKAIERSPVAGARLNQDLLAYLERNGGPIHPQYACKRSVTADGGLQVQVVDFPQTHPSYRDYMVLEVVRDLKECCCEVGATDYSDALYGQMPAASYELPDGRVLQLGAQRYKTAELLFKPDINQHVSGAAALGPEKGAAELVYGAIQKVDTDMRKEFWNNVVLAGGTTLLKGFKERVERDLTNMSPSKLRVTTSSFAVEKRFSAWIGGSILASLGQFQQLWISKAEYEETGSVIVEKKCP